MLGLRLIPFFSQSIFSQIFLTSHFLMGWYLRKMHFLLLVMLNIFTYYTLPDFYPVNMQFSSNMLVFCRQNGKCVDPDQMASSEASWFGSTVFSTNNKSWFSRTRVKKQYISDKRFCQTKHSDANSKKVNLLTLCKLMNSSIWFDTINDNGIVHCTYQGVTG